MRDKRAMNVSSHLDLPILLAPVTRLLCLYPITVRLPKTKLNIDYVDPCKLGPFFHLPLFLHPVSISIAADCVSPSVTHTLVIPLISS